MPETRSDWIVRGVTVYDGTGAPPRRADVAVRGDRIVAVDEVATGAGETGAEPRTAGAAPRIDGRGLALAPGFVDVHSHDDFAVLAEPELPFKLLQGVTTDVVGNCGMGAAPCAQAAVMAKAMHPGAALPEWEGYRGYLAALDAAPPSLNVAALVGHGTVRAAVMGDARRAPDAGELARLAALVEEGIDAGCVGYSTGLIYEPGRHAQPGELVALASVMRGSGALYATHMRDEGAGLLDSIRETLAVGEEGGVPVQVSHHKAAGRAAWGLTARSLALLDEARARGVDVHSDQYPYTAASTILAAVAPALPGGERPGAGLGDVVGEQVQVASAPGAPELEGRTLAAIAAEWELPLADAARRVLEREPATWVVLHIMDEEDVRRVLRHPGTMIGSDGIPTPGGKPHPRLCQTFPRVLGHYARDEGVLPLEEAVHRMTGLPARKFRLVDRGEIRPGAFADLVLFDPARIADTGTYTDPRRTPAGIVGVWVNGTRVVEDGRHTGARPGRALRRG